MRSLISIMIALASLPLFAQCPQQVLLLGGGGDAFGDGVSIDGAYALVGAPGVDDLGAAYVFEESDLLWSPVATLQPSASQLGTGYGQTVAISNDWIAVGAPYVNAGSLDQVGVVYIYRRIEGVWSEQQVLQPSAPVEDGWFGFDVALDDDTLVVGAPRAAGAGVLEGEVYVFERSGEVWAEVNRLSGSAVPSNGRFGWSVDVHANTLIAGAFQQGYGAAYVFRSGGGTWVEEQILIASDGSPVSHFGRGVAIHSDVCTVGDTGGSTGSLPGRAYVFRFDGSTWQEEAILQAPVPLPQDTFGFNLAIEDSLLVVGAEGFGVSTGAAYLYRYNESTSTWALLTGWVGAGATPGGRMGDDVAMSGSRAIVGALHQGGGGIGAAHVYAVPAFDCNGNEIADYCDVVSGFSSDWNLSGLPDECEFGFVRGDCNGNLEVDMADAITALDYLFRPNLPPACPIGCDSNGSGTLDLGDAIFSLSFLYAAGVSPPPPFPDCGIPTGPTTLSCPILCP